MRERVEACRYSGADVLCVVATEIGGLLRRGCATVDWELPHQWDPDRHPVLPRGAEDLLRSLPEGTAVHFVRYLGTGWIAVVGHSGEGLQVGDALGTGSCVASRQWTTLAERRVLAVLAIDSPQGVAAVRAAPGLIENVVERNPHVIADNQPDPPCPTDPITETRRPPLASASPVVVAPVADGEITERLLRFFELAGIPNDAAWLLPGATDADLEATEAALGFALPPDLSELLRVHNGVNFFDAFQWAGAFEATNEDNWRIEKLRSQWLYGLLLDAHAGHLDGPRTLWLAAEAQVAILYDMDTVPGRLLYVHVLSTPSIIPLCSSLANLVDCYIALAEAGFVTLEPLGPRVHGPFDEVRQVFVDHHVAHALETGIDTWLAWPGSADFTID